MKHALLQTLPGRAIVVGLAAKLMIAVLALAGVSAALLSVTDAVASVAIVVGGLYFIARALARSLGHVLWRVRRKLIISYIFIGFVPALLIAVFFVLGGLLLFSNFSAYLLQSRLRALADRADAIAETTLAEIEGTREDEPALLERRRAVVDREFPGASLAVIRTDTPCPGSARADGSAPATSGVPARPRPAVMIAGAWAHVPPPGAIPSWIACDGFRGILAVAARRSGDGDARSDESQRLDLTGAGNPVAMVARAVRFSDLASYALVVDLPVETSTLEQLYRETGVALTSVDAIDGDALPLESASDSNATPPAISAPSLPLVSVAFIDYRNWTSGRASVLRATIRMNVRETYDRIVTAEGGAGRYFGQGLLLALVVIGVLFLVIEVVALAAGLALARSITGSVHALFQGTERVRRGDFTHKIDVRARDQLGELAQSFNSMTKSIEDLLVEQTEKKRLEEELRIAHDIQMSLLPRGPLGMPGLSITALSVPAREVGGDYYDVLPLDDHRVGILIADVSGKGTSAALYMAEMKGLMLSLSRIHSSPRALLIAANRIIAEHLDSRSFITMTYAVLDLRARTITYARAGHTPLIYVAARGAGPDRLSLLAPDGLVLGLNIDDGSMFERLLEERTLSLHEGDLFLLFTDGISEAMDASDECFGEARLGRFIEAHAQLPSEELRERVLREIATFVGQAPQHDDMTMILLRIGDIASAYPAQAAMPQVARV